MNAVRIDGWGDAASPTQHLHQEAGSHQPVAQGARGPCGSAGVDGERGTFISQKYFQELTIPGAVVLGRMSSRGEEKQHFLLVDNVIEML